MKKSIFIILLMFVAQFQELFATTMIIDGCIRNQKYSIVRYRGDRVECSGIGSLYCPRSFVSVESYSHTLHPLDQIVELVMKRIESGDRSGSVNYKNDLPVNWIVEGKDRLTIHIRDLKMHAAEDD